MLLWSDIKHDIALSAQMTSQTMTGQCQWINFNPMGIDNEMTLITTQKKKINHHILVSTVINEPLNNFMIIKVKAALDAYIIAIKQYDYRMRLQLYI